MTNSIKYAACLMLAIASALFTCPAAHAQVTPITSEGWAEKSAGLSFYIEVPMVDNKDAKNSGIGGNITAESIINSVRYADGHDQIGHVVFLMDTGGGALHHAEAMEDIIDRHHQKTQYHVVVQNAISAGIWTAFSCDNIFMCRAGTLGGATAYYHQSAAKVVVAEDIDMIAARLELTAKRNGYPKQIIKPLMMMSSELHYWQDAEGNNVLSNSVPKKDMPKENYRQLDRNNTVLTLTTDDAVQIGIAKPIEDFDAQLVGEKIGVKGWTRGNRFGAVADEIGWVYNTTRSLEDRWVRTKLDLPSFPVTTQNRKNRMIKNMLEKRRKYEAAISALRLINKSLNELPDVHPERHLYLTGENSQTLLQDAEQWQADTRAARILAGKLNAGLTALKEAYKNLEIDESNLEDIEKPILDIVLRVNGIARKGNAAYWEKENK